MQIEVTQTHIETGVSQCNKCPVALAILDVLVDEIEVQVSDLEIRLISRPRLFGGNTLFAAEPPDSVCCFIHSFDGDGVGADPFSFELNIPEILLCSPST